MASVLPYVPGIGERLAPYIQQAGNSLGQGLMDRLDSQRDNKILSSINAEDSPLEMIKKFGGLSSSRQQALAPLLQQQLKSQQTSQAVQQKQQAKIQEQDEETQRIQNLSQSLKDKIKYTGNADIPFLASYAGEKEGKTPTFNRNALEQREQFDNEGFLYADMVFTKFNKGTISKDKLAVIRDKLAPNSKLSERENKARIQALDRVAGLPSTVSEKVLEKATKDIKTPKKNSSSKEKRPLNSFYEQEKQ